MPIWFVTLAGWDDGGGPLDAPTRVFARAAGYEPRPGNHLLVPGPNSKLGGVLFGIENPKAANKNPFLPGKLADSLPSGTYRFANAPHDARLAALAFALGSYRFTRYRKGDGKALRLEVPQGVDAAEISRIAEAAFLARDLINTPANDMGPAELEQAAREVAARYGAKISAIVGDDLLKQNFPLIHAVGRAAAGAPRLIDMTWGDPKAPKVTLGRQGRVLRFRRPRHQARQRHADHEKGHGRRGQCAGAGADGDGRQAEAAPARADSRGGECDLRRRHAAARYLSLRARASRWKSAIPTPRAG